MPAAYATAFLARLAWEGHPLDRPCVHPHPQRWLVALFKQFVYQGVLAAVKTATARQHLETLIAWLEHEQIRYAKSTWPF